MRIKMVLDIDHNVDRTHLLVYKMMYVSDMNPLSLIDGVTMQIGEPLHLKINVCESQKLQSTESTEATQTPKTPNSINSADSSVHAHFVKDKCFSNRSLYVKQSSL